jgi:hypothetical protein
MNINEFTLDSLPTPGHYDPNFKGPTPFEKSVLAHESRYPYANEVHDRLIYDGKMDESGRYLNGWYPGKVI